MNYLPMSFLNYSRADLAVTSPSPNSKWTTESWRLAKSTPINWPTKLPILGLKWLASLPRHFCSSCTHRYVSFFFRNVSKSHKQSGKKNLDIYVSILVYKSMSCTVFKIRKLLKINLGKWIHGQKLWLIDIFSI